MKKLLYSLLSLFFLYSCETDRTLNTEFQNTKNILPSDYGKLHNEVVLYVLENENKIDSDDINPLLKVIESGLKTNHPELFHNFDIKQVEHLFKNNTLKSTFNYSTFFDSLITEAEKNGIHPILKDFLIRGYNQEYTDIDQEIVLVETQLHSLKDKETLEIFKSVLYASGTLWDAKKDKKNNQIDKMGCDPEQQVIYADAAASILVGIYCPPCGVAAGAAASLLVSEAQNEEHGGGCI